MTDTLHPSTIDVAIVDGSRHSGPIAARYGLPLVGSPFTVRRPVFIISTAFEVQSLLSILGKVAPAAVIAWDLEEAQAVELLDHNIPICFGNPTEEQLVAALAATDTSQGHLADDRHVTVRLAEVERTFALPAVSRRN